MALSSGGCAGPSHSPRLRRLLSFSGDFISRVIGRGRCLLRIHLGSLTRFGRWAAQTWRATGSYKGQPLTLAADVDMLALDAGTYIDLPQGRMRELKKSRRQRTTDLKCSLVCRWDTVARPWPRYRPSIYRTA